MTALYVFEMEVQLGADNSKEAWEALESLIEDQGLRGIVQKKRINIDE